MTREELHTYIMSMPGAWLDYPFGEHTAVYKLGDEKGKLFAILAEDAEPVRLSLKCDPQLAEVLREKYETILPAYHLNKRHWNTIICSGQLELDELHDLIRHSYELVSQG